MKPIRIMALVLAAALSLGAGQPNTRTGPANRNWNAVIGLTPAGGHTLGNPAAPIKLVEYVSYTCPHCAHFEQQSEAMLRLGYVAPGKVAIEVRHYVRDPIDLAAALLADCGPTATFFQRHTTFLRTQERWMERLSLASQSQRDRWSNGPQAKRMRFIATDFGFYDIVATRGVDRKAADRCLADEARAKRLADGNVEADKLGVTGTPSFLINGLLLSGTHDWASLAPQLRARL